MRIYLVGYTGCGKSTVGRELAVRLKMPFIDSGDTADRMAKRAGTHYDCVNRGLMEAAAEMESVIVATGSYDARAIAKRDPGGEVVWIDTPFETIWGRLQSQGWGLRKKQPQETFRTGYEVMWKSFEAAAGVRVDGDGTVGVVVSRILNARSGRP